MGRLKVVLRARASRIKERESPRKAEFDIKRNFAHKQEAGMNPTRHQSPHRFVIIRNFAHKEEFGIRIG